MKIQIKPKSFMRMQSGRITGEISFFSKGNYFPEECWNDFPIVILNWWFDALANLATSNRAEFLFMDGPPYLSLSRVGKLIIMTPNEGFYPFECDSSYEELLIVLAAAANEVIQICEIHEWSNDELCRLVKNVNQI